MFENSSYNDIQNILSLSMRETKLIKDRMKLKINLFIVSLIDIAIINFYFMIVLSSKLFVDHFIIIAFFIMFFGFTLLISKQIFNITKEITETNRILKLSSETDSDKLKRIRKEKIKNIL